MRKQSASAHATSARTLVGSRPVKSPVSYTHLDVYKRQDSGWSHGYTFCPLRGGDAKSVMGDVGATTSNSVSYTHLRAKGFELIARKAANANSPP